MLLRVPRALVGHEVHELVGRGVDGHDDAGPSQGPQTAAEAAAVVVAVVAAVAVVAQGGWGLDGRNPFCARLAAEPRGRLTILQSSLQSGRDGLFAGLLAASQEAGASGGLGWTRSHGDFVESLDRPGLSLLHGCSQLLKVRDAIHLGSVTSCCFRQDIHHHLFREPPTFLHGVRRQGVMSMSWTRSPNSFGPLGLCVHRFHIVVGAVADL
mmetsp:Transcript_23096/g.49180  ORF Transcript_23096/g.49180 Transcript_23096/m.49180 type:complete len:211 (+) Transcript_23096:285-917(+)